MSTQNAFKQSSFKVDDNEFEGSEEGDVQHHAKARHHEVKHLYLPVVLAKHYDCCSKYTLCYIHQVQSISKHCIFIRRIERSIHSSDQPQMLVLLICNDCGKEEYHASSSSPQNEESCIARVILNVIDLGLFLVLGKQLS